MGIATVDGQVLNWSYSLSRHWNSQLTFQCIHWHLRIQSNLSFVFLNFSTIPDFCLRLYLLQYNICCIFSLFPSTIKSYWDFHQIEICRSFQLQCSPFPWQVNKINSCRKITAANYSLEYLCHQVFEGVTNKSTTQEETCSACLSLSSPWAASLPHKAHTEHV